MKIGELSALTGCTVPNIRFYEEKGLIKSTRLFGSNYRSFNDEALERLNFIMQCRANGMKLSCIKTLLTALDNPSNSSEDLCEHIDTFISTAKILEEQMRNLQKNLKNLKKTIIEQQSSFED